MDRLKRILIGVIISTVVSVVLLIIFSLILVKSDIKKQCINSGIMIITGISVFMGSFFSNIKLKKSGILNGLIIAILYIGILYIISSVINNNYMITLNSIYMILIEIILGIFGGILGVNRKS